MSAPGPPPDTQYLVPLRDAERELNKQMKALQGQDHTPLQRARMSNLVIFCTSLEQSILLNEEVPHVSAYHPARVLLLVGESGPPERDVTARVTVRPIPNGGRGPRHACAEQVTLHAAGTAVDRLPFAVRSLLIGDLPINLWWATPTPPPLAGPMLGELGEYAQQVIYDSIGWREPARGVAATAGWLEQVERSAAAASGGGRWRVASDLNWRRLKHWRRLLAQALDPATAPGSAESVTEVLLEHGPHAVVQAWLLASSLTQELGWRVPAGKVEPGVEMTWRFQGPRGQARLRIRRLEKGTPEVQRIQIACNREGCPVKMNLVPEGPQRLGIRLEGIEAAPRTLAVPPQSDAELIGRQLSDRERDPEFRQAMAVARVMAQSLLA